MEVDKPSSTPVIESDDNFSFDLDLPESDSHFHEKKNLLEKKGFKTKERIHLKNSLDPDAINGSLEAMLQIARIIKLDEVELYFSEDDSSTVEIYSPRNEFVSLNLILQLVNNALGSCTELQKSDLQELRNSVIGKVSKIPVEDGIKSVILEDQCCDEENCLVQWAEDNGMKSRLRIAYVEGAGRGTIAKDDLKVGDTALEIPISLLISEELVATSDMYQILEKMSDVSPETMVLLWSMKEKFNNDSKFKAYFDTLPEEFHTGLSCGIDALMAMDGTMLFDELMQAKQYLQAQYDELVLPLCTDHPETFPADLYTWEKFLWACELWYTNSMRIMFPDGELGTCLVPVAGFMNNSLYPHVMSYGKVDPTTNTLKFSLSRACNTGEECFLSYGNYSSSHLITFYGFLPKGENPYDIIPLEFDCLEDDESKVSNSTHMIRGTWFSPNHGIFHYGLPSRLLDYLRKANNPKRRTKVHLQESLESEMDILRQLRREFDSIMERLGDSDHDDRENTRWDVKLTVEYKDTQRKIVSSILASCYSGLRLLEEAWCKCFAEDTRG